MNNKKIHKNNLKYARNVASMIPVKSSYKRRIIEDILSQLEDHQGVGKPEEIMGSPQEVAKEFIDNIDSSEIISTSYKRIVRQYQSQSTLLGIPIISINCGSNGVAKGIIAIGDYAVGIVSIGGASLGILSIGGLSAGIFSIGGGAIALLAAVGGVAISSLFSVGGCAIAYEIAIGGLAVANTFACGALAHSNLIAMGDSTKGIINFYKTRFEGDIAFKWGQISYSHFKSEILKVLPETKKYILRFIKLLF